MLHFQNLSQKQPQNQLHPHLLPVQHQHQLQSKQQQHRQQHQQLQNQNQSQQLHHLQRQLDQHIQKLHQHHQVLMIPSRLSNQEYLDMHNHYLKVVREAISYSILQLLNLLLLPHAVHVLQHVIQPARLSVVKTHLWHHHQLDTHHHQSQNQ